MAERESVIDFTVPYTDLIGITIMMRIPLSHRSFFKFITIIDKYLWMFIIASFFGASTLTWLYEKWSPYSYRNYREHYGDTTETRNFTFKECLWYCMISLTPQGGGEAPKNLSGKFMAVTWGFYGYLL